MTKKQAKCKCGGTYELHKGCGCLVCKKCNDHKGLARCYCGWSLSGRDGRKELEEMGETIESSNAELEGYGGWPYPW